MNVERESVALMAEIAEYETVLPLGRPKILLVLGVMAILMGVLVSPDRLISVGVLKTSLLSELDGVAEMARLEVFVFRFIALIGGLACGFVFARWKSVLGWRLVRSVSAHQVSPVGLSFRKSNLIFYAMILLGGVYVLIGSSVFSDEQLSVINREEGVIESATAIIFFLCSVGGLFVIRSYWSARAFKYVGVMCFMSFGFFLFAGEEISWGQRILGLEVLEYFEENNVQGENNIHNLFGYLADHVFILGVFVYGFVMPVLAWRIRFAAKLFGYFGIPITSMGVAIGFLLVSGMHEWTVYRVVDRVAGLRIAELREMLSSVGFALLVYEAWRSARLMAGGSSGCESD